MTGGREPAGGQRLRFVRPAREGLVYSGRIDWRCAQAPLFVFPCSSVKMNFTGRVLRARIKNDHRYWENYVGYILDGKQGKIRLSMGEGIETYDIPVETEREVHELLLFKRQDACHRFSLHGFEIGADGEVCPSAALPERRIEVYGDSVSAGEVSEAVDCTGRADPAHNGEYSNSWYSYAWMTARALNAQIHDIAQGGVALMDGTGYYLEPERTGMERIWDKCCYDPGSEETEWDFSAYTPQAVIVAIGQNDSHPRDFMAEDYDCAQSALWRARYRAFLENLRRVYPLAHIICCTTLLCHDPAWDRAIGQVCGELGDEKVSRYLFGRNGCGTPGHLRISEAEEMAGELAAYMEKLGIFSGEKA